MLVVVFVVLVNYLLVIYTTLHFIYKVAQHMHVLMRYRCRFNVIAVILHDKTAEVLFFKRTVQQLQNNHDIS